MSKRTAGTIARTWWATPEKAVLPLLAVLEPHTIFIEVCGGDGALVRILEAAGHVCTYACDVDPRHDSVTWDDALQVTPEFGETVITNPPFALACEVWEACWPHLAVVVLHPIYEDILLLI